MFKKLALLALPLIIHGCANLQTLPGVTEAEVKNSIHNQMKLSELHLAEKIDANEEAQAIKYAEKLYKESFVDSAAEKKLGLELGSLGEGPYDLGKKLDKLVNKNRSNSIAYLLRGRYKSTVAYAARGEKTIQETPEENIKKMTEIQDSGIADLKRSIELDQRNYLAYSALGGIYITRRADISKAHENFDKAIEIKPDSFIAWSEKLWVLTPKWGGSYEKMNVAITEMNKHSQQNPNLKSLQSYVLNDQGYNAEINKDYKKAKSIYSQALSFGEDNTVLLGLGYVNIQLGNAKEGCPFIRKAVKQRPYRVRHNVNFLVCEKLGL